MSYGTPDFTAGLTFFPLYQTRVVIPPTLMAVRSTTPASDGSLLETRLPYLDTDQRREVLRTTAIRSGNALLDDVEGWGRLNLYAAADGYGAFDTDVTVNMDGSLGAFAARDFWRNNIGGVGKLTKRGTGELDLTGENDYRGGTQIDDGVLVAASQSALGRGGVSVNGGTLIDFAPATLHVGGDYAQSKAGTLEIIVGRDECVSRGTLVIDGNVKLSGRLEVVFRGPASPNASIPLIFFKGHRSGEFNDLAVTGLSGYTYSLIYTEKSVALRVSAPGHRGGGSH